MISFETTREEMETIDKIVKRIGRIYKGIDKLAVSMDITACHCNGNKLRLDELLKASEFEFVHDVSGIMRNIDRNTGKLGNWFSPRYSA